jgi:hypothetical protein
MTRERRPEPGEAAEAGALEEGGELHHPRREGGVSRNRFYGRLSALPALTGEGGEVG